MLVLIPGLNNPASMWRAVVSQLPAGVDAITLDLPPLEDVDRIAAAVAARIPEGAVLVGHSFGGYVALAVLARDPARVRGVALVNSECGADTEDQRRARLDRADAVTAAGYEDLVMGQLSAVYHPDHLAGQQAARLAAERREGLRDYGVERFVAHSRAAAGRPDRTRMLREAGVPVLVVAADDDRVIPTDRQCEMARETGAEFRVIGPAGHMLPAEQPAALAEALADWVRCLSENWRSHHVDTELAHPAATYDQR